MIIQSKHISLGEIREEDLETFFAYRSDEELLKYQNFKLNSIEEALAFIKAQQKVELGGTQEWKQLGIYDKSGKLVGDCALKCHEHEARIAEIGITIASAYHRKSYAYHGLSALINHAFIELKLHKIVAEVDVRNKASQRLMNKLGFELEGQFKSHYWDAHLKEWFDEYHYGLVNPKH